MTAALRTERVEELSESSYLVLRNTYHVLRELKGMVDRLHGSTVQGAPTSLDQVAASSSPPIASTTSWSATCARNATRTAPTTRHGPRQGWTGSLMTNRDEWNGRDEIKNFE
ncbi:hypothetical protein GMST_42690 [Geomonas silvestris]|uniref:Uncharacterized protein n=1 Tax=Geomonas silvestris TaxID=2740184 RepID=A0A6V8MPU1_9BACT|nr:hypothetical protein GMST_42690 [Geomonas silvestris]